MRTSTIRRKPSRLSCSPAPTSCRFISAGSIGEDGGAFFFERLPASGLEVDLPLIATFPLVPQPDAGLAPDVPATLTQQDIVTDRDAVMETALELAKA
jgi:hypothetical protein